jgi:hypothetical protein
VGVDVVREAEDRLLVGGVPLHRDLDLAVVGLVFEEDGLAMQGILVLVQVADEVDDPALVMEVDLLAAGALVDEVDLQSARQECRLAQALGEGLEVEPDLLEDLEIGEEGDLGPGLLRSRALLELRGGLAARVVLRPDVAVAANLEVKAIGKRVDDRYADTVKATGDLVAGSLAELGTGVKRRQHDLGGGLLQLDVLLDRDPAPVVDHRAGVVGMQGDRDVVGVTGDRLVYRVVDDFVDQVVETARAGRPDVHPGALANRLEALENGDVLGAVAVLGRALRSCFRLRGALGRRLCLRHSVPFDRSSRRCKTRPQ